MAGFKRDKRASNWGGETRRGWLRRPLPAVGLKKRRLGPPYHRGASPCESRKNQSRGGRRRGRPMLEVGWFISPETKKEKAQDRLKDVKNEPVPHRFEKRGSL